MEQLKNENEEQKKAQTNNVEKEVKGGKKVLKATAVTLAAVVLVGSGIFIGSRLNNKETKNEIDNNSNDLFTSNNSESTFEKNEINVSENKRNDDENNNSSYNTAISEIKKCLKDKEWLKNNVMMKKNCFGNNIEGDQVLTFMKIKSDAGNAPMVAVEATSETDISREVFLVSYNDGKVTAKSITGFANHISHGNVVIDPNNQMADNTYFHMGYVMDTYIDLKNANIEFLDTIAYYFDFDENEKEKRSNFTKRYGKDEKDTDITEEEYNTIHSIYEDYKFYEITTELTDNNIDKYIK